jgi:hypothetical protein
MPSRYLRASLAVAMAGAGVLMLSGCIDTSTPTPTPTATASPAPTTPTGPAIDLDGTATDNLPYFDQVNGDLIAAGGTLDGRAFIDNLVAAGYPKSDLEVTSDTTAINGPADNIQFAVRLNGTCLIGQYGNIGYASTAVDMLATGRCLVGATRPIDW